MAISKRNDAFENGPALCVVLDHRANSIGNPPSSENSFPAAATGRAAWNVGGRRVTRSAMRGLPDPKNETAVRHYLIAQKAVHRARQRFPWYDAVWLRAYVAARTMISQARPELLPEFMEALERLRTPADFRTVEVDRVFDENRLEGIRETIRTLPPERLETHEAGRFGRSVVHDHPDFLALHRQITPMVSDLVGEEVEPSYNFLSLYSELGVCEPHLDSPEAKWTLDICLDQSRSWPIQISQVAPWPEAGASPDEDWRANVRADPALRFTSHSLSPGGGVVFSGSSQWHYRDILPGAGDGDYCHLLFLHFVPAGARDIVRPRRWPEIFGMPELSWVIDATHAPPPRA